MFVVFDLDGTLADDTHRQHFLEQLPQDWDGYFAACGGDAAVEPVVEIFKSLIEYGHHIEVWTGRSDAVRSQTFTWMQQYPFDYGHIEGEVALRMRPAGDFRPDTEVKGEWLAECGDNPPDLVFDDRTKSVAWWREQGITCLQVAQHDY